MQKKLSGVRSVAKAARERLGGVLGARELRQQLEILRHSRDQLRLQRDELREQRDHYRAQREGVRGQRDKYREQRDRLREQRDEYRKQRDKLREQRDEYRTQRDKLREQCDGLVRQQKELREQHDELAEQQKELRTQRDQFRSQRDQFRSQRDQFRSQRDQFRSERDEGRNFSLELLESPVFFFEMHALAASQCPACDGPASHLCTYPYPRSAAFASALVAWCGACGMGWVPRLPLDLGTYYVSQYAVSNRGDRDLEPEAYFSEESPMRRSRYFRRAAEQIERVRGYCPNIEAILDFGSGPGYALFQSDARHKHAIEYDEHSKKYLDYLGAMRVALESLTNGFYDVILSSHSLEHLEPQKLYPALSRFRRALKPEGILYVEVPGGALGAYRSQVKHEPHTLFFSPEALHRILVRAGFDILFEGAVAKKPMPPLDNPIYAAGDRASFYGDTRGRLTFIARPAKQARALPVVPSFEGVVIGTCKPSGAPDQAGGRGTPS